VHADTSLSRTITKNKEVLIKSSKIGPGYYDVRQIVDPLNPLLKATPSVFFGQIKSGAISTWSKHNFLPSVTAAQAAIESGWGTSGLTSQANNLFGIKGSYHGQYIIMPTKEWVGDHYIIVNAKFRKYPTWAASVEDHGSFFTDNSRYHNLLGLKDYRQVARLVQQDGYATDPNYANTIISIIEQYGLQAWDQEAFNEATMPAIYPHSALDTSVITMKYDSNHGAISFHSDGSPQTQANQSVLTNNSSWHTSGSKVINGQEMFLVGNDEYVPLKYTTVGYDQIITINCAPNQGVYAYHLNGNIFSGSDSVLRSGSKWKFISAATINGEVMYEIATNEYVPKRYTQFGNGF
ncbi:cell wall hydrolase, partial [Lactobacillus sp. XV13L]|nr:cell wall hydrolase [Lactobacillus sp. XV13L]